MPSVDDIVEYRCIHEMDGVQGTFTFWNKILDLGNSPSITDAVNAWALAFVSQMDVMLSLRWALTCVIYRNITDPSEPEIPVINTFPGLDFTESPHPSDLVMWTTRYARRADGGKLIVGRWSLNGFVLPASVRGRIDRDLTLTNIEAFQRDVTTHPAGGWQHEPHQEYTFTPGSPGPPVVPPVMEHSPVLEASCRTRVRKLNSRSTGLCRLA